MQETVSETNLVRSKPSLLCLIYFFSHLSLEMCWLAQTWSFCRRNSPTDLTPITVEKNKCIGSLKSGPSERVGLWVYACDDTVRRKYFHLAEPDVRVRRKSDTRTEAELASVRKLFHSVHIISKSLRKDRKLEAMTSERISIDQRNII